MEIRPDGKANTLTRVSTDSMVLQAVTSELTEGIKGAVIEVKNKTITAKNGITYPVELPDGFYLMRKFTPIEAERLQTIPDDYTACISNTQRYKAIGNGWTVNIITHILKSIGD